VNYSERLDFGGAQPAQRAYRTGLSERQPPIRRLEAQAVVRGEGVPDRALPGGRDDRRCGQPSQQDVHVALVQFPGSTSTRSRNQGLTTSNSSVVYVETIITAHYIRDRDQVAQYALRFDHLRASALDDRRSLKLIRGE